MDSNRKMPDTLVKDGDSGMAHGREAANDVWEKSLETVKGWSDQAKEAWVDAQKLLQKYPGKAAGAALLVGVAIGSALMGMRKKK